jgi:hypothetical protein
MIPEPVGDIGPGDVHDSRLDGGKLRVNALNRHDEEDWEKSKHCAPPESWFQICETRLLNLRTAARSSGRQDDLPMLVHVGERQTGFRTVAVGDW